MFIDKAILGAAIKRVRSARGFTQAELATAAGLAEGGKSVALIEQGRRSVSMDSLNAIAKALRLPPACLTILGSQPSGKNSAAGEFMESLQQLISTVIFAQAKGLAEQKGEETKKDIIAEQKRLSEVASLLRSYAPKRSREPV